MKTFDLVEYLRDQIEFSRRTFGPGPRTTGVLDHLRKEIDEVSADPTDLEEWIDIVILAFEATWRATGASPEEIVATLSYKQAENELRNWPDWRTADPGQAIEHVREGDN